MKTQKTKTNKTDTAAHFNVSLTTMDNWLRRGCPHTDENGTRMFDLDEVKGWRICQDAKNNVPSIREFCAKPVSELIAALDDARSRLFFYMNANHWMHPAKTEIHKRLERMGKAIREIEKIGQCLG